MKLDSSWTVEQVLATYPQVAAVFIELKTDCVGCHLDRFCTLDEVASAYELPLDWILQKLHESIQTSPETGE